MKDLTNEVMKRDGATTLQKVCVFMDDNKDMFKKMDGVIVTVDDNEDDPLVLPYDEAVTKIFELDIAAHYKLRQAWICEYSDRYDSEYSAPSRYANDIFVLNIKDNIIAA